MDYRSFIGRSVKIVIEIGGKAYFYTGEFQTDGLFRDKFGIIFSFSEDSIKRIEVVNND